MGRMTKLVLEGPDATPEMLELASKVDLFILVWLILVAALIIAGTCLIVSTMNDNKKVD